MMSKEDKEELFSLIDKIAALESIIFDKQCEINSIVARIKILPHLDETSRVKSMDKVKHLYSQIGEHETDRLSLKAKYKKLMLAHQMSLTFSEGV